jgi:hypothetical protein
MRLESLLWLLLAQCGYDSGKPSLQANLSAVVGDSSGGWIEYIYRQEKGMAEIVILRVHQRIVGDEPQDISGHVIPGSTTFFAASSSFAIWVASFEIWKKT